MWAIPARQNSSLPLPWRMFVLASLVVLLLVVSADGIAGQTSDGHGNTPATATLVSPGSTIAGRIDPGDDMDVFKLDLSQASGVTDVWAYTTGELDTVGGLYDSDGTLLIFSDDSFLGDNIRNFSLRSAVQPGVYYVVIVSFRPRTGGYVLHAEAVTEPGSTLGTAKHLELDSYTAGTTSAADDVDFFRLDFTQSTHLIIDAVSPNPVALDAQLLDASGTEIGENVYSLADLLSYLPGGGFWILDHFSPGMYYVKVSLAGRSEPRPVTYTILAVEDTEYAEYVEDCDAKTRTLNDPSIRDPLYACQWHLNSPDYVDINVEPAWEDGVLGEDVNIAVVDRGMDVGHEDLKDNVDIGLNHDYNDEGNIYNRYQHHGTHVAGIIAARDNSVGVRGVAPRATI